MKICFTGAQCTGKTTLINALEKKIPWYEVQRESVRYLVKKYGFNIEGANADLQMALLNLQTRALFSSENVLLDRSFIDSSAYMSYYINKGITTLPTSTYDYIIDTTRELSKKIDLYVFTVPEFSIVEDGFRLIDKEQQSEVTEIMAELFKAMDLTERVLTVHGSVDERIEQIMRRIS